MAVILWVLLPVFVLPSLLFPDNPATTTFAAAGHVLFLLAAALLFWSAAVKAASGSDVIHYQISLAMLIWAVAVALRALEAKLHQPGYGTIADGFWAVGSLVFAVAAFGWFRFAGPSWGRILGTAGILIATFTLLFALFLNPLLQDSTRSALLKTLDVFYIAIDLLILGFLCAPASKPGARGARLVLCGALIYMLSDVFFIHHALVPDFPAYSYLDVPYAVADFVFALGGYAQRASVAAQQV